MLKCCKSFVVSFYFYTLYGNNTFFDISANLIINLKNIIKMKYLEKYIDYNDLDKIIESNDYMNCKIKKGAEKFIKTRPSEYQQDLQIAVFIDNIPKVRTRNDVIKTGLATIIRAESIGFTDGWCLDYNAPFCCHEAIVTPYVSDESYEYWDGKKAKISDVIDEYLYHSCIHSDYWRI